VNGEEVSYGLKPAHPQKIECAGFLYKRKIITFAEINLKIKRI